MTNEQINKKINEVCGWDYKPVNCGGSNFCNDLNAMQFCLRVLTLEQLRIYAEYLESEFGCFGVTATARQRAEAFLRTLGKWEEAK